MRGLFGLIFAASGAAALIYEVTWTRLLTLELGHGVAAASTVLAAFMGGLAVGSAVGGRIAARTPRGQALRLYAALEIAIAVFALVLPFELDALDPLLASAYANGAGGTTFGVLRFLTSLVLLSIPAAAMGATFPVAARWFVQGAGAAARDAGALYAANTIGAAIGALTAGFVLLPFLGLQGATWVAVALNAIAAGGAWVLAQREATTPTPALPATASKRKKAPGVRQVSPTLAAAALGVSGFASLTLQVVWTRLLALILGPTTYAFSIIVSVFIAGLAIGAAVSSRFAARAQQPLVGLAACLALSVGLAGAAAALVDHGLLAIADIVARPDVTFREVLVRQGLLALALLLPMTIAFGAAFPFAVAAATRSDETVASDLGRIYAVNTAGAIAGALVAGFVLIPAVGLHGTLRIVVIVGGVGATALLLASHARGRSRAFALAISAGVLALGVWLPEWDRLLLSSGAYKYAAALEGPDVRTALSAGELLYYREGASATVAVRRVAGTTSLAIDGKVDASNAGDMLTQRLLAHVPLLLHPNPRAVAILGLGSGVTLGSALTHPTVERADVLEISPGVVEAARYFDRENHRATLDPRTRLIVGDGRTHLVLTRDQYDVIVSEPSNPWMAGIASLFTQEFFRTARQRLTPDGVFCQWAHTYDMSTRDLQSIVATFMSVFPDGMLWLVGDGDVLLIGSHGSMTAHLEGVSATWARDGVSRDLQSVGVTSPGLLLSLFVADGAQLATWAGDAPIQSDNRAALEFSGPQSIFGPSEADNARLLRTLAAAATPPRPVAQAASRRTTASLSDRGQMLLQADAFRPAYDDFVQAVEMDPSDARALDGLIRASAALRRGDQTRALLSRLAADPARRSTRLALSRLLASQGAFDEAVTIAFEIVQNDPSNAAALEQLASILSDVGDLERMRPVVARLRAVAPSSEAAHYYSAALLFMEQRIDLALGEARRVVALNPAHARGHNLMGAALASLGQRDAARSAFQASLAADSRDPATYTNLATLELQAGHPDLAQRYFAEALTIDPTNETAREGLTRVGHPK